MAKLLLLFLERAWALGIRVEVCTGATCKGNVGAWKSDVEIVGVNCLDHCGKGPNVRCLVDGAPSIFGADAMTMDEREAKCFFDVTDDRRRMVLDKVTTLRDRLTGISSESSLPQEKNAVNFFSGYEATELQNLLNVHESIQQECGPMKPSSIADADSVQDLHTIVQALVEQKNRRTDEPPSLSESGR